MSIITWLKQPVSITPTRAGKLVSAIIDTVHTYLVTKRINELEARIKVLEAANDPKTKLAETLARVGKLAAEQARAKEEREDIKRRGVPVSSKDSDKLRPADDANPFSRHHGGLRP